MIFQEHIDECKSIFISKYLFLLGFFFEISICCVYMHVNLSQSQKTHIECLSRRHHRWVELSRINHIKSRRNPIYVFHVTKKIAKRLTCVESSKCILISMTFAEFISRFKQFISPRRRNWLTLRLENGHIISLMSNRESTRLPRWRQLWTLEAN